MQTLQRPASGGMIAGVLSGLARYFDQDPVLFRLLALLLLMVTGIFPGLVLYVLAWLMIPKEPAVMYEVVE